MTRKVFSLIFFCAGLSLTLAANNTSTSPNNTSVEKTNQKTSSLTSAVNKNSTSPNNTSVEKTTQETSHNTTTDAPTLAPPTTATSNETTPTAKTEIVKYVISHEDKPCLLANFNTNIRISYEAEGEFNQSVAKTIPVEIGDDVDTLSSQCAQNNGGVAKLSLRWGMGTFKLVFNFKTYNDVSNGSNPLKMWSLNEVIFTYDKTDKGVFPDAVVPEKLTVSKKNMTLFSAIFGESYRCNTGDDILVGEIEKGAAITLTDIHLQPFAVEGKDFSTQGYVCEADTELEKMKSENWLVPVVVAGCLAFIILVLIIVYVITRNAKKAGYRNMDK